MLDWQPIHTAPKDGTMVLLWSKGDYRVFYRRSLDAEGWLCPPHRGHGAADALGAALASARRTSTLGIGIAAQPTSEPETASPASSRTPQRALSVSYFTLASCKP